MSIENQEASQQAVSQGESLDGSQGSPSPAGSQNPNIGKVQQCEDCGEIFTITRRYNFCRSCFCPECGDRIDKTKGYCAICSMEAERFEEMAYGRDD